jgi:hypothetical protein
MENRGPAPSLRGMRRSTPAIWALHGQVHTGSFELRDRQLHLTGRRHTFSAPLSSIQDSTIERGPADRLRGLPVLTLLLADGEKLRLASLAGAGTLGELAALIEQARYTGATSGT